MQPEHIAMDVYVCINDVMVLLKKCDSLCLERITMEASIPAGCLIMFLYTFFTASSCWKQYREMDNVPHAFSTTDAFTQSCTHSQAV